MIRLYRASVAYDLSRSEARRVLRCTGLHRVGDSGACIAMLEGAPGVVIEPDRLAAPHAGELSAQQTGADAVRWAVVIGRSGDLMVALAADRVEMFAPADSSARPIDLDKAFEEIAL